MTLTLLPQSAASDRTWPILPRAPSGYTGERSRPLPAPFVVANKDTGGAGQSPTALQPVVGLGRPEGIQP